MGAGLRRAKRTSGVVEGLRFGCSRDEYNVEQLYADRPVRVWVNIVDDDERGSERYATASWQVLSTAQDVVSETTGTPWPKAAGATLDLALPFAHLEGSNTAPAVR